jgi:hypothetical protein
MFLHIGGAQIVFNSDLIGIFNYDLMENNDNRNLLKNHLTETVRVMPRTEHPKSFVITTSQIYTSPISPLTLSRRKNRSC